MGQDRSKSGVYRCCIPVLHEDLVEHAAHGGFVAVRVSGPKNMSFDRTMLGKRMLGRKTRKTWPGQGACNHERTASPWVRGRAVTAT
jgi:hypothetical protein